MGLIARKVQAYESEHCKNNETCKALGARLDSLFIDNVRKLSCLRADSDVSLQPKVYFARIGSIKCCKRDYLKKRRVGEHVIPSILV